MLLACQLLRNQANFRDGTNYFLKRVCLWLTIMGDGANQQPTWLGHRSVLTSLLFLGTEGDKYTIPGPRAQQLASQAVPFLVSDSSIERAILREDDRERQECLSRKSRRPRQKWMKIFRFSFNQKRTNIFFPCGNSAAFFVVTLASSWSALLASNTNPLTFVQPTNSSLQLIQIDQFYLSISPSPTVSHFVSLFQHQFTLDLTI